jgi:hypothetical protein
MTLKGWELTDYWFLPSDKSLPKVSDLILALATARFSIQKPQSGWI